MKFEVLIADEMHDSIFEMLTKIGVIYSYLPEISRSDLKVEIAHCQGLVIRSKTKVDADLLENANELRFIARAGAGLDLIDLEYCKKKNIALFAANEGNRDAVAEHVIGMILSLFNKINLSNSEVKSGIWQREPNRGIELMGKTWAILGYGNNGRATAQKLSGFGVNVLAYDKFQTNYSDQYAKEATMEEIFVEADIISIHVPLTSTTHNFVNDIFLQKFNKDIYLINIARGEIVILNDLLKNINNGKVLGACLDVLENEKITKLSANEKLIFDNLCNLPNVILTPHVAGWTHQSYKRINEVLVNKISNFIENHP
jgi:D-3-phosphoglycerate dehydrogenase / 2-oxoglutarate reductase